MGGRSLDPQTQAQMKWMSQKHFNRSRACMRSVYLYPLKRFPGIASRAETNDSFDTMGWYQKLCASAGTLARSVRRLCTSDFSTQAETKMPLVRNATVHELRLVISTEGGALSVSPRGAALPQLAANDAAAKTLPFSLSGQDGKNREGLPGIAAHCGSIQLGSEVHSAQTETCPEQSDSRQSNAASADRKTSEDVTTALTMCSLIDNYRSYDCPNRDGEPRDNQKTRYNESRNCLKLLEFFKGLEYSDLRTHHLFQLRDWIRGQVKRKDADGKRIAQLVLNTLKNVLKNGVNRGLIEQMPPVDFPSLRSRKGVRHAGERMPGNIDIVHGVARHFFKKRRSQPLGWQLLIQVALGLRTIEALRLRAHASHLEPGWISPDRKLIRVWRAKGQEKRCLIDITPEIDEILVAIQLWHDKYFPDSPWLIPSPQNISKPLGQCTLTRALDRLWKSNPQICGQNFTAHGARALNMSTLLDQGKSPYDVSVAAGHTSGGSTVIEAYDGRTPQQVLGTNRLSFKHEGPAAWNELNLNEGFVEPINASMETSADVNNLNLKCEDDSKIQV